MATDGTAPSFGLDIAEGLARLHEQALESMRLFASEVAPRIGEAAKA